MSNARPIALDTRMGGIGASTAAYVVAAEQPALIDTGPAASLKATLAALDRTGVGPPAWILVTHAHLDHAGAAGHLAARFAEARVAAPARICHHLVEPSALYAGTKSVWKERTDELLGEPIAIAEERITPLLDNETIDLGGATLRAIATPGHTRHHFSYLEQTSGALISGDALGIRLPGSPITRAASPPSDFQLAAALASIERIRDIDPVDLLLAHFGSATEGGDSIELVCDQAQAALRHWTQTVALELGGGTAGLVARVDAKLRAGLDEAGLAASDRLEKVNPAWLSVAGIVGEIDRGARP